CPGGRARSSALRPPFRAGRLDRSAGGTLMWRWAAAAVMLALLALPLASSGYVMRLLVTLFTFAVMAEAWSLLAGRHGYPDLGTVIYFGLGGYVTAVLLARQLPLGVAIPAGGAACAGVGLVAGVLLLRLPGPLFAAA